MKKKLVERNQLIGKQIIVVRVPVTWKTEVNGHVETEFHASSVARVRKFRERSEFSL